MDLILIVLLGVVIYFVRAGMKAKQKRLAERAERDRLAAAAASSEVWQGTHFNQIPDNHPLKLSIKARISAFHLTVQEPANPFWSDVETIDEDWWALGTCPEESVVYYANVVLAASRQGFADWLHQLSIRQPEQYAAYLQWCQNERMLRLQQEMLAEQRRTTMATQAADEAARRNAAHAAREWQQAKDRAEDDRSRRNF